MKKILLSMMACAALCACTSDDALVDNPVNAEVTNGLYMKFNISMADATRSTTTTEADDDYVKSSNGTEEGTDKENNVARIVVVLTDTEGKVITTSTEFSGTSDTYYVVTFEAEDIEEHKEENVNVFVYCNMPESFEMGTVDDIYGNGTNSDGTSENVATAWTDNMFFMSNAKLHTETLPSDFTPYKDSSTPYDIGTVYVERSCARMDYKDGAIQTEGDVAFTYPMMVDETTSKAQIDLVLSDIALINMSNQFYYLRHMAPSNEDYTAADLTEGNVTILTPETNINWVIDTDAEEKIEWTSASTELTFTYPLETPSEWEWTSLASFCIDTNTDNYKSNEYHPWRYLTENTIPSIAAQKNGITTGVVFKAQITPGTACSDDLKAAFDGESTIYAFENQIVGTWKMVQAYAEKEGNYNTSLAYAYRQAMNLYGEGENEITLSEAQAEEGFTGYSPDESGDYYCYYYYWNRHNDNGQPGVMGTMEFDVVRNNVYKLSVTGINYFGHAEPGTEDPDPDPVNPDDPDEDDNVYIQVSVQILPWVVRVNDIKF